MNFGVIRKAIVAGLLAGLAGGISAWANAIPNVTRDEVTVIVGSVVVSAFTAGLATYKVRNAGTVNGSLPPGFGERLHSRP